MRIVFFICILSFFNTYLVAQDGYVTGLFSTSFEIADHSDPSDGGLDFAFVRNQAHERIGETGAELEETVSTISVKNEHFPGADLGMFEISISIEDEQTTPGKKNVEIVIKDHVNLRALSLKKDTMQDPADERLIEGYMPRYMQIVPEAVIEKTANGSYVFLKEEDPNFNQGWMQAEEGSSKFLLVPEFTVALKTPGLKKDAIINLIDLSCDLIDKFDECTPGTTPKDKVQASRKLEASLKKRLVVRVKRNITSGMHRFVEDEAVKTAKQLMEAAINPN